MLPGSVHHNPAPAPPGEAAATGGLQITMTSTRAMGGIADVALQVVGAGLGRTGTTSLKQALEQLLGAPCYHMLEVRERPSDPDAWGDAYEGRSPRWEHFFDGYRATVDWPGA